MICGDMSPLTSFTSLPVKEIVKPNNTCLRRGTILPYLEISLPTVIRMQFQEEPSVMVELFQEMCYIGCMRRHEQWPLLVLSLEDLNNKISLLLYVRKHNLTAITFPSQTYLQL